MQLQRNDTKRKRKKPTTLSLSPSNLLSHYLCLPPPSLHRTFCGCIKKNQKKLSPPAKSPPRLPHTTSLSFEIKTTLHTITLFLLTTLLTNTNNSHKSHKHKPNERTTEEPTDKQHPKNTSPPSPPQLQTKPNPKISHTSKKTPGTCRVWTGKFTVVKWRKAKGAQISKEWIIHIHSKLEIEKKPLWNSNIKR
jgi:hypothetical protein